MERIRPVHHLLAALVVLAVAGLAQAAVLKRSSTFTVTVNGARQSAIMVSWPVSSGVHYGAYLNGARVATGLHGPSYVFGGLNCGTSYLLGIDSYTSAGARSPVTTIRASTAACPVAADTTPPSAPSNLQVLSASTTSVSVGWTHSVDNVAVTGYRIYFSGSVVTTIPWSTTTFSFSNLSCGHTQTVGVAALDAAGNASPTTTVATATSPCPSTSPAVTTKATTTTQTTSPPPVTTTTSAPQTQKLTTQAVTTQTTTPVTTTTTTQTTPRPPVTTTTTTTTTTPQPQAQQVTTQATTTTQTPPPLPQSVTTTQPSGGQAASLFVAPSGSDMSPCSQAAPCASLNGAYQLAKAGQTISVAAGTYPNQVIQARPDLRSLSCTPATPSSCVHIVGSGVTIAGSLEIHASDVWVDGGQTRGGPYGITVTGYTDTEADSSSSYPDHVVVSGVHSTSFGVFNADTVTFEDMDIGAATISTNCQVLQGPGIENKIGFSGGNTNVPTNVTLDGLVIHDQNGDSGRIASDCHFGGLFLMTANGLTVENTVFQGNVVYNVQIQNFGGAPAPTNVVFDHDSFGCPVTWLYNGAGCDNQSSIQFDGTFPSITVKNSSFAEGGNAGWGCYVGTCDYSQDSFSGNTVSAPAVTAAALT